MLPQLGDHILIAVIALVYPVYYTTVGWPRRDRPLLRVGRSGAQIDVYRHAMIELWVLTAAVVAWWFVSGRSAERIGLGVPAGWAFWIGVAIVVALAVFLGSQVAAVRRSAEVREKARRQLREELGMAVGLMIPRTDRERRVWIGVSLTAGICEELLYRAFFIWYLMAWFPAAVAVAVSSVVFGAAHLYLGWGGVIRATLVGAFFAVAYLLIGSIWVPIVLHAIVDIGSGLTGSAALAGEPSDAESRAD